MIRVVADTNILVSANFWMGKPRRILELASDGLITIYSSDALLQELEKILIRDFQLDLKKSQKIIHGLKEFILIVEPRIKIERIVKDPEDNKVLECAKEAKADFIVSGDRHILEFDGFEGIKIMSADAFLRIISENH